MECGVVGREEERMMGEGGGGGEGRGDCGDDTCVVCVGSHVKKAGHFASNPPEG